MPPVQGSTLAPRTCKLASNPPLLQVLWYLSVHTRGMQRRLVGQPSHHTAQQNQQSGDMRPDGCVYVSSLAYDASEANLRDLFAREGAPVVSTSAREDASQDRGFIPCSLCTYQS